jgi:hypothetical protein
MQKATPSFVHDATTSHENTRSASQPTPARAVETAVPTRAVNIDDVAWQKAIGELKRDRPAVASFLEYGAIDTTNRTMKIAFHNQYASIAKLAEDRIPDIKAYLRKRFNADVSVIVSVTDKAAVPDAAKRRIEAEDKQREWEEEALSHPLVRQILSEFGARVSGVQIRRE